MRDTYYFSHDYNARTDSKIKRLISRHGMAGYGIYWGIIEDLYQNANALPTDYESIAFDLRTDAETLKSIVNDFDLFQVDSDLFGSLSVQRRLDQREQKSSKARVSAYKRWKNDANALPTQSERNAIKGKESKGKEKKEDNEANVSPEKDDNVIWVISILNQKAGTSFKPNAKATQRLINARIKEGYTGKDFRAVISHKVKQWADDPAMSEYLRPSTLFGTKFESYLNAAKLAGDDKPREFHRPKDPVH